MKIPDDFRPPAVGSRPRAAGGFGILAFLIVAVFALALADRYLLRSGQLAAVIAAALVDFANEDRTANAIGGLSVNPLLTAVAQAKAEDMAAKGYFAHVSPDGKDPWYWYKQKGYAFLYAGENLAVDFSDSGDVEHAWMNSPTHRANLLNTHFSEIGIATAQGTFDGHPTTFVVEEFGTPAPATAPQAPVTTVVSPASAQKPALATTAKPEPAPRALASTSAATAFSESATTSALVALASTSPVLGAGAIAKAPPGNLLARVIGAPSAALAYAYDAIGILVLALLAYATRFELRTHHARQAVAAGSLFALMAVLLIAAHFVFFAAPVLAAGP